MRRPFGNQIEGSLSLEQTPLKKYKIELDAVTLFGNQEKIGYNILERGYDAQLLVSLRFLMNELYSLPGFYVGLQSYTAIKQPPQVFQ